MRRLAVFASSFSIAIAAGCILLSMQSAWLFAVIFTAAGLLLYVILGSGCSKPVRVLRLALLGLGIGFLYFGAVYGLTVQRAHSLDGETADISVSVTEYPAVYSDYVRLEGKIISGSGKDLNAIIYDNTGLTASVIPGDRVSLSASLKTADVRYGSRYDAYNASGIFLTASGRTSPSITSGEGSLLTLPQRLQHYLSGLVDKLYSGSVASFMKSLMLGDRSDFYSDSSLSTSLSRAGVMHIVAVSGMHISFLVGFLQLVFGSSRKSSVICIALVWFFVLLTGASPSAMRAGFMQTMVLLAPVFNRENDFLTSLTFALMAILIINPFSIMSASLQLTFAAMAGLALFATPINSGIINALGRLGELGPVRYIAGIISSSLSVMIFSAPIAALQFGSVQILSPVTNIFILFAVPVCFIGGYISAGVYLINAWAGKLIASIIALFARHIIAVSALVAKIPFATVYLVSSLVTVWLALTYCSFAAAYLAKLKGALKGVVPGAISALTLAAMLICTGIAYRGYDGTFTFLDVGQGACTCVMAGDSTVVIDCGNTASLKNAGQTAGEYLLSRGRTRVDALVLTHLHEDHASGVVKLMEYVDIGAIIYAPHADSSVELLDEILAAAQKGDIKIITPEADTQITAGGIVLKLYVPDSTGADENERCLITTVTAGDYTALITGDSPSDSELEFLERTGIDDVNLLVAGHHGSKYSSTYEFITALGADTAVISTGYNTYGHPTNETLARFEASGYNLYRTDLNGTVEIRLT